MVDSHPYVEIAFYLKAHRNKIETVYNTLTYFDGIHLAPKITARTLFSVGLMDNTCPPSTVFAAYNRLKAKKEINIYNFNNHEGGGPFQIAARLRFATEYL
jgi:cephalosporin-C deacetylase